MAKRKRTKKTPEKYQEKLVVNATFDQVLRATVPTPEVKASSKKT